QRVERPQPLPLPREGQCHARFDVARTDRERRAEAGERIAVELALDLQAPEQIKVVRVPGLEPDRLLEVAPRALAVLDRRVAERALREAVQQARPIAGRGGRR